jgi:hypothetical protein
MLTCTPLSLARSVAVEHAHRQLAEVGLAWQLPAEDSTVLTAGFTELAAQLGTGGAEGGGDPVALVHTALAGYPRRWLLVFDNARTGLRSGLCWWP